MAQGTSIRRVTVNLPRELLARAEGATGKGVTQTIVQGLEFLARRSAYAKALKLRGKLDLDIDIERSRERARR
jgi:hypothetical protein